MATKTSVVMQTTDQAQKKSSRSITYIDPNASNADIKNFIEGMNNLTTQTLSAANRVDTTDILTSKLSRNLTLSQSSIAWNDIETTVLETIVEITGTLTGVTTMYTSMLYVANGGEGNLYVLTAIDEDESSIGIGLLRDGTVKIIDEITFIIPENDTYAAATVTLTIT